MKTYVDGTLTDDSLEKVRLQVQKASNPSMRTAADKKRKNAPSLKAEHEANRHNVLALENACKSGLPGGCLKEFVVDVVPERLPQGAQRYEVPIEEVALDIQADSPDRFLRMCVELPSGENRWECEWGPHRKSCWLDCDRGPSSFPGYMNLFQQPMNLRGDAIPDILHRRHDGVFHAWHMSGVTVCKVEMGLVFTFFQGAFGKNANFSSAYEMFMEWWRSNTYHNSIF